MMCVLEGTSITTPDTPQSTARLMSSTMQREKAMISGLGQRFGAPDLVVFGEDDAGLLFAVAQRDVVKLDLLRKMELIAHGALKVPRADEPLICLPGFLRHNEFLQIEIRLRERL